MKKINIMATSILAVVLTVPTATLAQGITVQGGDTLYSLASENNLTINELMSLNDLNSNTIHIGQTLLVTNLTLGTVVNAERLNVRTGPSVNNEIKTTINKGTVVEIISTENGWSLININGVRGYVSSYYIKSNSTVIQPVQKEYEYLTANSGLFQEPGKTLKGTLAPQRVKILEQGTDGWFKIQTWLGALWVKNGVIKEVGSPIEYTYITSKSGLFKEEGKNLVNYIGAQRVVVLAKGTDGWFKIQTWLGPLWVKNGIIKEVASLEYTYVTSKSGLFKEVGKYLVNYIGPQRVVVLAKGTDGWIKIQTWLGPLWFKNGVIKEIDTNVPAPAPIIVAPPTTTETVYTVVSGDTLSGIAAKFNLSLQTLMTKNNLTSTIILVGQKLKVGTSVNDVSVSTRIFLRPTEGIVTSNFGPRWGTEHKGVDFAKSGNVQIKAAARGTVTRSYLHSSYGEVVFIKHTINGKNYETVYAHMRSGTRAVKAGDIVTEGQLLGWMGSTGNSTGQHLHFEVHIGSYLAGRTSAVNPLPYIK
jgi:murein DD-endopeptidase MepM/ murein hydrolase activator NlpD